MTTATRLKRSEKCYLAGMRSVRRKLNEEAKEYDWLDRCLELIRQGEYRALSKMTEYYR